MGEEAREGMGGIWMGRVRARKHEQKQSLGMLAPNTGLPLSSSTIHTLRPFLVSRHASPPPASSPRPPPFAPRALALTAKRAGHASCQFDGAPSLRYFTHPKSSSAKLAPPAFPCYASFRNTRGGIRRTRESARTATTRTSTCR